MPDELDLLPEPESEFNLAEYLGMVRRHWKLVAAAALACMAAGAIHYSITPKAYSATATIQIERRSLAPALSTQAPWLESYFDAEYYPTEYKLLESRGLAERVVKRLDLLSDPAFNPGAAGRNASRAATAEDDQAVLGNLAERVRSGLAVEPVRNTQLVEITYRAASPTFATRAANAFADAFIDMGIEYRFTSAGKTSTFLSSQIETLKKEIEDKEAKLQAFSRRTDIVTMEPSSNVTIQRLNALNASYIEAKNARIDKESTYRSLLTAPPETIADSLQPGPVGNLRSEELRLEREYDAQLKVYKPEWPAMAALKSEIEKSKQHLAATIKEAVDTARKSAYTSYDTALRQEHSIEAEINKLKSQAMDQNSQAAEFQNLGGDIKTSRELLDKLQREQSENEVQARLQDTRDTNVHVVDRAMVPGGPFYPSLRKDVSYGMLFGLLLGVGTALLIEFLDRTVKTAEEVERRIALPTLAVIQDIDDAGKAYGYYGRYGYGYGYGAEPQPVARVRPRGRGDKQTALPAGAGSSGGAADQGSAGTPSGPGGPGGPGGWSGRRRGGGNGPTQIELVPHELPRTQISEAYRSLRTALLLSSARELKVVAVTSAAAGEGKTATATNLAIVLAQLGRPVLIVDADLRKPRLHQVFKISNQTGLVSHLTSTVESDEIVHATTIPNLWITPSGPIAPNPSELLSSDRMFDWLRAMRLRFEYIIIDTPPALAVTDATIVGVIADGVVLTLRSGKVTREEARLCRDRLRQADVRILGAVLNRYRSTHSGLGRRYRAYESYVAAETPAAPKAGSAA
ncbi:MAG TPA: polysaccharide biosynthesis tyrosine autokinase [Thermoanaerobaculia bacterium]|nr:polysaccharide biosynthesis tyrosine autokinase [Thermoanaerobaculia bacterium]